MTGSDLGRRCRHGFLLGFLACGGSGVVLSAGGVLQAQDDDARTIRSASEALRAGRPWYASRLLEPVVRRTSPSPAVVLLAARAAAAWQGWAEVERLLAREPWLDSLDGGAGRVLLARAALELDRPVAASQSLLAASVPGPDRSHGRIILARVQERRGLLDSARSNFEIAAAALPEIADWLSLRAAALNRDREARARTYASIRGTAARSRITRVEAGALERAGDLADAATAYEKLGARVEALRVRLVAADSVGKAAIRGQLLTIIASATARSRAATALLDSAFGPLTAREQLIIARSAARVGPASRAAAGFTRAASTEVLSPQDRYAFGTALAELGRHRDAITQFSRVLRSPLAGQAAYYRARSLLRAGDGAAARAALDSVVRAFPADTVAASLALYLQADLATDDLKDAHARALFLSLAHRYPRGARAAQARFRAAMIAFVAGSAREAAIEFDSLTSRFPRSSETQASLYWSGRAWAVAGDSVKAKARWREVERREPLSYYAGLAAARLGAPRWQPAAAPDSFARVVALERGVERARRLAAFGLDAEADYEYAQLVDDAGASTGRLLSAADAFRGAGLVSRSMVLARRASARGAPVDARTYRLLYPAYLPEVLLAESRANDIDPALVAGLIRQESDFNPGATSRVGARGLMQIMPAVGRQLALNQGLATWDDVLLYQPDVSLHLGTAHLAQQLRQHPDLPRALAAYNAGNARVARWSAKRGVEDAEVFVERIPFVETRDYVRAVLRNRDVYRTLYESLAPPRRAEHWRLRNPLTRSVTSLRPADERPTASGSCAS